MLKYLTNLQDPLILDSSLFVALEDNTLIQYCNCYDSPMILKLMLQYSGKKNKDWLLLYSDIIDGEFTRINYDEKN